MRLTSRLEIREGEPPPEQARSFNCRLDIQEENIRANRDCYVSVREDRISQMLDRSPVREGRIEHHAVLGTCEGDEQMPAVCQLHRHLLILECLPVTDHVEQ